MKGGLPGLGWGEAGCGLWNSSSCLTCPEGKSERRQVAVLKVGPGCLERPLVPSSQSVFLSTVLECRPGLGAASGGAERGH